MNGRRRLARWMLVVACAAGAVLLGQRPATAQWGQMSRLMDPPVTSDDVDEMLELMEADGTQEEIIRDLFQGLMQKHNAASEQLREILKAVSEEARTDPSVWQDFQRKAGEYMQYQDGLKESFFDDVRLVLTPGQSERWPAFERYHRRQHLLDDDQTLVTAARVDLVRVLEDAAKGQDAPVGSDDAADVVERYEIELDRLLVERKALNDAQLDEFLKVMEEGKNMMTQMPLWEKMFNEQRELQLKIRDVNEKYLRLFAARLEPEASGDFREEYQRRAMPTVYERNYMDEAFETAEGLESLTGAQAERIEALRQEYEREVSGIREQWAASLRERQEDVELMSMWGGGGKAGGPEAAEQRDAKEDLDERYYERLRDVLDEDQRANLPEREKDWRNSGGFGFGD